MKDEFIFYLILCFVLVITFVITIYNKIPIATDIYSHLKIAEGYAHGKNMLFDPYNIQLNRIPYPPLFHLMFVPFFILGRPIQFTLYLQIIFYPLAVLSTYFLASKLFNTKIALITIILLLSSMSFWDRTFQVNPQSMDMILFPLSVYFFLKDKKYSFIATNLILFYSHGFYFFVLFLTFIVYYFIRRDKRKLGMIILSFITFIPLVLISSPYILSSMSMKLNIIQNPQQTFYLKNPLMIFGYIGFSLTFIPLISILILKRNSFDFKDNNQLILFCWMIALIPFLLNVDRFLQYITIPLSIITSLLVFKIKDKRIRLILIFLAVALMMIFQLRLILFINSYQITPAMIEFSKKYGF